ncbi:RNI-like protein [Meira miltonrushii]|uniref:RNI-like protein n=1 Tax=Meira miltonrushii TaxID=1280837 RepID=A0A316VC15_9BASI|nr:RNI-like protein [Meira miltonrushii]PWN34844.1 RNI-like protein [Meira miltonrushii]
MTEEEPDTASDIASHSSLLRDDLTSVVQPDKRNTANMADLNKNAEDEGSVSQISTSSDMSSNPTKNVASSSRSSSRMDPSLSVSSQPPPSIHKRKLKGPPKGILKPAPPPAKAFSFRRDVLQQLNTRLAQQGVNVQVPVPSGSLAGTAQGTAQAASSLLGGMFKKVSSLASASAGLGIEDHHGSGSGFYGNGSGSRSASATVAPTWSSDRDAARFPESNRANSMRSTSSESTLVSDGGMNGSSSQSVHSISSNNLPQPSASIRPLRKVRFIVSDMTLTYPISGAIAPGDEDATRRRIEQEQRQKLKERNEKRWTVAELEQLYRECCRTREELPLKKMRSVFQDARQNSPPALKTIDLSFIPLDRHAIEPVADLLSVDFGLQKLVLENCGLADDGLKSILHALLVSGSLPSLSLASNKRIKYHGWRYVGIFMRRAKALKYLDLSENNINKASLEHIIGALRKDESGNGKVGKEPRGGSSAQSTSKEDLDDEHSPLTIQAKLLNEETDAVALLTSLRLENCGLKTSSLELLSQSIRFSELCHLSLRRNRINQFGAVALALMLKDYPDNHIATAEDATAPVMNDLAHLQGGSVNASGNRQSSTSSPNLPDIPVIVSSPGGGVLRRTLPPSAVAALQEASSESLVSSNGSTLVDQSHDSQSNGDNLTEDERAKMIRTREERRMKDEAALALYRAQRAKRILSSMPRMGHLLTLDLKSNDLRGGVIYLGHALKKNRTLKVLNLSDNSIEVQGLVAIADALKYNSTLETLDMSHNPCSGPGLEGITTLRNAFTLNSNLKRLFLSDTELSSEGAIALAEFLPEARSLIHLDLTENLQIDIAGVMAMAVSVKMNKSLRCLDLNIPANAPDFARLSQDILNSCIRNTELAQKRAQQKGVKAPIAAPIYKSSLARAAKEKEESSRLQAANRQLEQMTHGSSDSLRSSGNQERRGSTEIPERESNTITEEGAVRITDAAQECISVLRELLAREKEQEKEKVRDREIVRRQDGSIASRPMSGFAQDLMTQSRRLRHKLKNALGVMEEGDTLIRALQVNDDLETISMQLTDFYSGRDEKLEEALQRENIADGTLSNTQNTTSNRLTVPTTNPEEEGLSSPNFSIGSDDEDDEEAEGARAKAASAARSLLKSSSDVAAKGLEIVDESLNVDVVPTAAREKPTEEEDQEVDPESEIATHRAKGQLSEEGEIFRRAKSLSIGEDDEEDEGGELRSSETDGNEREKSKQEASPRHSPNTAKSAFALLKGQLDVNSGSHTDLEDNKSESAISITSEDRKDVSGEELRKELLGAKVPRRSSSASASSETSESVPRDT